MPQRQEIDLNWLVATVLISVKVTMNPNVMPTMTVVTMEMAARSTSLRWPAKDCVITVTENMARRLKMEGPAICHIFFDSADTLLLKLPLLGSSSRPRRLEINKGSSSSFLIFLHFLTSPLALIRSGSRP